MAMAFVGAEDEGELGAVAAVVLGARSRMETKESTTAERQDTSERVNEGGGRVVCRRAAAVAFW